MKKSRVFLRLTSQALAAALILVSPGLTPYQALAGEFSAGPAGRDAAPLAASSLATIPRFLDLRSPDGRAQARPVFDALLGQRAVGSTAGQAAAVSLRLAVSGDLSPASADLLS